MNVQERKEILHFIYGIEKYLLWKYSSKSKELREFKEFKNWFLFKDFYSLRKLIMQEISLGITPNTETKINLILNDFVKKDIKASVLMEYLNEKISDYFLKDLQVLINKDPNINLNDFLSQGQVVSKIWLIKELKNYVQTHNFDLKNIAIYGSWYGFLVPFLYDSFTNLNFIRGFDLDAKANHKSEIFLNRYVVDNWKYKSVTQNVNEMIPIGSSGKLFYYCINEFNQKIKEINKFDLIINTSAEHMNDKWLENLRKEQVVCVQTNNIKDIEGHINAFDSFEKAKDHYRNLGQILWSGKHPLMENYERYMFFLRRRNL